ncbi:MAG: type II secretion system F family protein [Acidimicrobiia bacterium]|nr:type II secretion system F family protein [bacterium]MXW68598.1 type II secretion system F family protein [Acidimicrobiia bacterium]MXX00619.1 type II secretion system F family protein [Acidimicrobiia bacterium]MXX46120.1 type II secretion system F family protein [Acidimicrobiia bacterium]MXY75454.1 type II secretion system F family protein [Acidimicrobiia bacterium]
MTLAGIPLGAAGAGSYWLLALVMVAAVPFRWWWMAAGLGVVCWSLRRYTHRNHPPGDEDIIAFGRLLVVPLTGGMSLANALTMASQEAHPQLRAEVARLLRRSRQEGMATALAASGGLLGELFRRMAGAHSSGTSPVRAVLTHVENLHSQVRTESLSRIRSLPVTLAVPLTLLIVPGFLLVLVGPSVVSRLAEMLSGLTGA